ncbi:serine hydrolase [Legionella pneumophila serogroup 1]|uniref:serine hydrolase n=1 Tax=Legionella pneumophila TaxID=446 RepID=UPI0007706F2B|nr:serine hydrolase [Legionella pneumophila]HAT8862497.1 serine hydrolase [Legionella pneumophila subsp. pneumophila]MDI9825838.1 serine hydrolase [Legionella pneumophila]MDW8896966.1 serine hydrolase [Legionella pneumophila]CZH50513.1 Endo-1%2C4-beta-xylanase Y precursor [Legionella pneumophila]CZI55875.1 Endo-1%2C4-beta-xylanase Y precursor [Legionella pneumophila]
MPESIKLVVTGESAGIIEVVIDNTSSELTTTFIYTPNPETPTPKEMLLGYRDASGKGHMLSMTKEMNGQWIARRSMAPNESSDFFMHPDVKPGELTQKPNIINKIALSDGRIVTSVYENPELAKENKGSIQKRILNAKGILSEPVDEHYQLGQGEQLVEVYFPAGYKASEPKLYNIQVMLDGEMHLRQDAFGNSMGTKDILDNLIAEGKMESVIAVFVSPTQPTMEKGQWVSMPRLKEYGCDLQTDTMLANIPGALRQAGIQVTNDPLKIGLCGQSMGGLQALYTAKMHPDIYGQVIAQSPAVWWGPSSSRLNGEEVDDSVRYENDRTWRVPLANKEEQQYLLRMLKTGYDDLSKREVPKGEVNIHLQAGTHETGDRGLGDEPLAQATMFLAKELHIGCRLHNGGHAAEAWATGLALLLPQAHPRLDVQLEATEVDEINGVTRESTKELMNSAKIPGVTIASCGDETTSTMSIGETQGGKETPSSPVVAETVFGAASLSKPVFAYLVLKLIETNKADEAIPGFGKFNQFNSEFNLKTPLYEVFRDKNGKTLADDENPFLKKFVPEHREWAKKLNAEMVLSHRTGLHIVAKEPFSFQFEPGKHYAYSGPGIDCLQEVIKTVTDTDLETLAWANVFGPHALNMSHTTYGSDPVAANSLKTTASDYAKFITSWINDDKLNYTFRPVEPVYSMKKDYFPQSEDKLVDEVTVKDIDREQVTWGLGIGLVKNDQGEVIGAYHTGDMNEWRAGFGAQIDPETGRCVTTTVYCANSHNGHILAEHVLPKTLAPALNYFFPTYGFARNVDELDGTDFHGMNPQILKPELREKAYQTKTVTHHYKEQLQKAKSDDPHDTPPDLSTSFEVENQQKHTPLPMTPKPPWEQ